MKTLVTLSLIFSSLSIFANDHTGQITQIFNDDNGRIRTRVITNNTPAPQPVKKKSLCERKFEDANLESEDNLCYRPNTWSSKKLNEVKWADFFSCANRVMDLKSWRYSIVKDCSYKYEHSYLMSNKIQQCIDKVEKISKNASINDCLERDSGEDILSSKFDTCYAGIEQTNISMSRRIEICSSDDGRDRVQCYKTAKKYIPSTDAWRECSTWNIQNNVTTNTFNRCMGDLDKLDVSAKKAFYLCTDYEADRIRSCIVNNTDTFPVDILVKNCDDYTFRTSYNDSRFKKCVKNSKDDLELEGAVDFCKEFTNKLDHINSSKFSSCLSTVKSYEIETTLGYRICSSRSTSSSLKNPKYVSCVMKGLSSGIMDYFKLRQEEIDNGYGPKDKNAFYYVFNDCKDDLKKPSKPKYNQYLSLYRDYNIHSDTQFGDKDMPLGGLSALRFDTETNLLYLLSDDRGFNGNPRIYVFDYDFSDDGDLEITAKDLIKFKKKKAKGQNSWQLNMDPEGFDFTSDGNMVVSSEMDDLGGKDFLTIFDMKGEEKGTINIDEAFRPVRTTTRNCRNNSRNNNGGAFNRGNNQDNSQANNGRRNQGRSQTCYVKHEDKGLQQNKSFESLSISPDKNFLYTANEAALYQDKRYTRFLNRKVVDRVRIVKYKKVKNEYKEMGQFFYELEIEPDNGLVEVLALNENILLTLERSWDNAARKLTSRIYLVNIANAENILGYSNDMLSDAKNAEKELIMDLDDIKKQLSPGFRRLDNLEGMALGPKLPNGKQSLVLITDNNFSDRQRSLMIIFEVDVDKLVRDGEAL